MAATTETVGPATSPAEGVMVKAMGSSISSSGTSKPGTLMADVRSDLPAPGTASTFQRAGTVVGLDRSKVPSVSNPTLTMPKKSLGEEPTRKGEATRAVRGKSMRCPVEKASTRLPCSEGAAPATCVPAPRVMLNESRREREGLKVSVKAAEACDGREREKRVSRGR